MYFYQYGSLADLVPILLFKTVPVILDPWTVAEAVADAAVTLADAIARLSSLALRKRLEIV